MRLLTAIDQLFILLENRNQPMHIGGLFLLEIPDGASDTFVSDLSLPPSCLITSQIHHGKSKVVKGNSLLHAGDTLYVALPVSEIHTVRQIFEGEITEG